MAKTKRYYRGQLVQDIDNNIFIHLRTKQGKSNVVRLDEYGVPIGLDIVNTNELKILTNIPENFKSIQIKK